MCRCGGLVHHLTCDPFSCSPRAPRLGAVRLLMDCGLGPLYLQLSVAPDPGCPVGRRAKGCPDAGSISCLRPQITGQVSGQAWGQGHVAVV